MRPERAGESRRSTAPVRTPRRGDISKNEVGSRPGAVRVAAVPWSNGRPGSDRMFVPGSAGASWEVIESERVARPMGTQD